MSLHDSPLKLGTKVHTAIYTASDEPVCVVDSMQERVDDYSAARRLVACWNACMGISTETLEGMPGHYYGAVFAQRKLDAERRLESQTQAAAQADSELQRVRVALGLDAQDKGVDLAAVIDMLQSWQADATKRANLLAAHLCGVLEIARTWQPDYATKMDRDTIELAAAEAGER